MTKNAWIGLGFFTVFSVSSTAAAGGTMYEPVAGAFAPQGCGGGGCWSNYVRAADITGDGLADVVVPNMGGFFSLPGIAQDLEIHTNNGDATFANASATAVGGHVARNRQVAIGDVDGDGDLDIYAPDGNNNLDAFFINDGTGSFEDELDMRLPGLMSNAGAARFADVDGDGDLDLILADGYGNSGNPETLHIYVNDGTGVFAENAGASAGTVGGSDIDDVDVADFDRDFDLDILINPHQGPLTLWLNDGTGAFEASPFPALGPQSQFHYNPGVCDVDGDGDLDVFVDNTGGGYTEQLLINDGSAGFTDGTGQVSGNGGADDNGVACVDVDNDGDFDAIVINVSGSASNLRMLENDGAGSFTSVAGAFPAQGCALWAEFAELDGDGRPDVVVGAGECGSQNRVYRATAAVPADDRPPAITHFEEVAGPVELDATPVVRYAVSDRFVTDAGAELDRAFAVLFPDGDSETVDAAFMGGDLYRVVLPAQNADVTVSYQLCATDTAGNLGCTETLMYDVGMGGLPPGGTTGGTDTGDSGVDDTAGPPDGTAGPTTMSGGMSATDSAGTMTAGGTADGSDGTSGGASDDGGSGCACTSAGTRPQAVPAGGALVLLLAGLGLGRGRRRRS